MRIKKDKIIIWDFQRTIYNPDTDKLIPGAKELLKKTKRYGYINILYSTNKRDNALVSRKIRELKIGKYCKEIVVRKRRNIKDLYAVISKYNADLQQSFLVSDRVRTDIKMGNLLGLKTIWLRAGKFAEELPRNFEEEPLATIKSLEILKEWFSKL